MVKEYYDVSGDADTPCLLGATQRLLMNTTDFRQHRLKKDWNPMTNRRRSSNESDEQHQFLAGWVATRIDGTPQQPTLHAAMLLAPHLSLSS